MHGLVIRKYAAKAAAFGLCLSLIIMQTGCSGVFPKEEEALSVPLVTPAPVEYKTKAVELATISNEVTMKGQVVAATQQNLFFTCEQGRLKEIFVSAGDQVKTGDVLASIETDDLDTQIALQKLEVSKAQILYDTAGESKDFEHQIAVQQLEVNKAQLLYDTAAEGTTEKTLALMTLQEQQLQLEALKLQSDASSGTSDKSLNEINLKQQKINLEKLEDQKEGTLITAPIDGEISYTTKTNIGDVVAGYETIVTICDPATLLIGTDDQQAIDFSVDGDAQIVLKNDTTADAVVIETPDTIDPDSAYAAYSFLRFSSDIPEGVSHGTNVTINYVTEKKDNAIVLPKKYVVSASNRKYVVVLEGGLRVEKDVTVGISNSTDVEILTGLAVGDLYILN